VRVRVSEGEHDAAGLAGPDEPWAAAAARIAEDLSPTAALHLWPHDLSGGTAHFVVDRDLALDLRAMTRGDLPDLADWLRAPHVRQWWHADGEPTETRVAARYGPRIDGDTPTRMWVIEVNGRSIGFVQDYRIRDYPDFALLAPDPDALGLDYAIGDPHRVGRGLGARVVWAWMLRARRDLPDVGSYFAAPDHRNLASLRILAKAGFVQGTWFDEPQRDGTTTTAVGCTLDVRRVLGPVAAASGP
jgi:aminoglycoside 6'-N-acetyltransferase